MHTSSGGNKKSKNEIADELRSVENKLREKEGNFAQLERGISHIEKKQECIEMEAGKVKKEISHLKLDFEEKMHEVKGLEQEKFENEKEMNLMEEDIKDLRYRKTELKREELH